MSSSTYRNAFLEETLKRAAATNGNDPVRITVTGPEQEKVSAFGLQLGEIVYLATTGPSDMRIKTAAGMIEKDGFIASGPHDTNKVYLRYPKGSKVSLEYTI